MLIGLLLFGFISFCNGMVVQQITTEAEEEGVKVHEKWNQTVASWSRGRLSEICCRCFYFIVTIVAYVDARWEVYW